MITADQPVGAYWIQLRGLGECGIRRVQQLAVLRYARGPYQPTAPAPTYDVGIPQGVVSIPHTNYTLIFLLFLHTSSQWSDHINACRPLSTDKKENERETQIKMDKKKKKGHLDFTYHIRYDTQIHVFHNSVVQKTVNNDFNLCK